MPPREYMASGALIIVLDQKFEHPFVNEQFREEDELNFHSVSRMATQKMGVSRALSPWHFRACPEASDTITPPTYRSVQPKENVPSDGPGSVKEWESLQAP